MKQSLSRPQRAMLANAIACRPLEHGLPRTHQSGPLSTVQALHRKGMLAGINHLPTAAGRTALDTRLMPIQTTTERPGRDLSKNLYRVAEHGQVINNETFPKKGTSCPISQ